MVEWFCEEWKRLFRFSKQISVKCFGEIIVADDLAETYEALYKSLLSMKSFVTLTSMVFCLFPLNIRKKDC